jgi:hypothetical protein
MDDALTTALEASTVPEVFPVAKSLPTSISRSYQVMGVDTDCFVQLFGDHIVLGVSQLGGGKIGTFVSCQVEETVMDNTTRFNVNVLLGKRDDPLVQVYARRITEKIAAMRASRADICPPVLLGISITRTDPEMFTSLIDVLVNLYKEAIQIASS